MEQNTIDKIHNVVDNILIKDGPDGHTDGSGYIVTFIVDLINTTRPEEDEDDESIKDAIRTYLKNNPRYK